jgi:hypothetical protein
VKSLGRIMRMNYAIGAVLIIAAALTQPRDIALGIAVGVALTCANFFVLSKLISKWTADAAAGKSGASSILVLPKMIGLMLAVVVALAFLPIDPAAFAIGYSTFIVSIMIEAVYSLIASAPPPPSDGVDDHHG